jgi:hypothetical protein
MLRAAADAAARRGGFAVDVSVAPMLEGPHDRLLLGVGRELLTNVGRHAGTPAGRCCHPSCRTGCCASCAAEPSAPTGD